MTRLGDKYKSEIKKAMQDKFAYKNVNTIPKLEKIVINCVTKDAVVNGKVVEKDRVHKGIWEFYVRNTEVFEFKEWSRGSQIEKDIKKNKILIEKKVGNLKISYCSSRKLFDFVTKKILNNENYILGTKPIKL